MTFTFNAARPLSAEEASPMQALISRALETFTKGTNAAYLPRQKEADIFSKEIGPLAALASSPQFQGFNPQIQKMIADRIGGYLGHGQQSGGQQESSPGYASDRDIYDQLQQGSTATQGPGAKGKVAKSNVAGAIEKIFGENAFSKALGGSGASGQSAAFEQAQQLAAQKLILKGYPADKANAIVKQMPGENDKDYAARMKPLFVSNQDTPIKSADQKEQQDDQERADAEATAEAFGTTPEMVLQAQSMGVKTKKEFKEFLKWSQKNG